eukprot:CAMPEP_0116870152 /NCGR_PEP_ID=MMETSP0463-20121206/11_1 /TAXON_ID=181622 /ORGANISM="Strombidinopsis sp, Strain SopsisLIS2011" /LENGTH=194 /DNA_ID=CAMNT_0004506305 /DNA_START=705 /DNA_END=1292 /DNA_ORIENTATION=+
MQEIEININKEKNASSKTKVPVYATVYFDINIKSKPIGRMVMELFRDTPMTSENFRALCTGEKGIGRQGRPLHYKGCHFHRVIPGFMCQGGDITDFNGLGGESIYGLAFADENFKHGHCERGLISMANVCKNSNNSQFFFTFTQKPHLDGKHVVFGRIIEGMELLKTIEDYGSAVGNTREKILIADCGQIVDET